MVDLYIKKDDEFIKLKSIESFKDIDCLIFKMDTIMSARQIAELENHFSYRTRKECIVVDARVEKIYGVSNE